MIIVDKLTEILDIIKEIETEDQGTAAILMDGFKLSLNIIDAVIKQEERKTLDISEHLEIVTNILGINLRDLVMHIIQTQNNQTNSDKEPDAETLDFITGNLDDYEKFLAQAKVKEDIDFLNKSL